MPRSAAKRKPSKKASRVSVMLTPNEYAQLEKLANASERSMSWLGRFAVRKLLEYHVDKQLPLHFEMPKGES